MQQKVLLKKGETRKRKKQHVRKSLSRTDKRIQVMTMTPHQIHWINKQLHITGQCVVKSKINSTKTIYHLYTKTQAIDEIKRAWCSFRCMVSCSWRFRFDVVKFFQCFPKITDKINELRDKLNVRVISTTDPLKLAARTDPTTATATANSSALKTAFTTSNLAVTTATTEPTTAMTTADCLATEIVLTTSNLVMTAKINEQWSRAYKRLQFWWNK